MSEPVNSIRGEPAAVAEEAPNLASRQAEFALGVAPTGHAAVDTALEGLRRLPDEDVSHHPDIFDRVQSQLHAALTELDDEP